MKSVRTLTILLLASGFAAANDLASFLSPVSSHPGLAAVRAQLAVEEARLANARDPVTLTMSAGYSAFDVNTDEYSWLPDELAELFMPPDSASQLSLDLTLRPVPLGDMADFHEQALLQLGLAELAWREALTGLQVAAVNAAYSLQLAEESLELAREGEALARRALESTELRFSNGAATEAELRDAAAGAAEAASFVSSAEAGVVLARLALSGLVGDAEAPPSEQLRLGVPDGEAASVQRARLQAGLALVGASSARRGVLPVVQAGYTRFLDDNSSLGVSIESRTLQPNLNWTWQSTGRAFPQNLIEGSFTIGVSASISPAVTAALRAAQAQEQAAEDGLAAAITQAALERAALLNELETAEARTDLADLLYRNARSSLDETTVREELGLAIPLETQAAALAVMRAELDLKQARLQQLEASLALYEFTARPLTEEGPR